MNAADPPERPERLVSLDVARGATVVGMILVNSTAYLHYVAGAAAYPVLMHAEWAGFTAADLVFPAFVVLMGASIGLAPAPATPGRIGLRTVRLLLIGLALSNMYWLADMQANAFRPFGVLQRLALAYGAAALLHRALSSRARLVLSAAILALYWPLLLAPLPDGTTPDLHLAGANVVSWIDRAVLGVHAYVKGPLGYDPEGILSTLPTIAQCLIGVWAGERLRRGPSLAAARDLAVAGVVLAAAGLAWAPWLPLIKGVWTSSYVLLSTGATFAALAAAVLACDVCRARGPVATFLTAFGANAVFAYALHELASVLLATDAAKLLLQTAQLRLQPEAAALVPVLVFVLLCWWPLAHMQRRGWLVKV